MRRLRPLGALVAAITAVLPVLFSPVTSSAQTGSCIDTGGGLSYHCYSEMWSTTPVYATGIM